MSKHKWKPDPDYPLIQFVTWAQLDLISRNTREFIHGKPK